MGDELRDLAAHSRSYFVGVPEVNPGIYASVDHFLNRFAKSGPMASNAR